jgi:hypothetical protein
LPALSDWFGAQQSDRGAYTAHRLAERLAARARSRVVAPDDLARVVPPPRAPQPQAAFVAAPAELNTRSADDSPQAPAKTAAGPRRQDDASPLVGA